MMDACIHRQCLLPHGSYGNSHSQTEIHIQKSFNLQPCHNECLIPVELLLPHTSLDRIHSFSQVFTQIKQQRYCGTNTSGLVLLRVSRVFLYRQENKYI